MDLKQIKQEARRKAILSANRWKHRRRMAYIALGSTLLVTYWCLFTVPTDRLDVLGEIVTWFYMIMGSIVASYLGFSTLDDKWRESRKKTKTSKVDSPED